MPTLPDTLDRFLQSEQAGSIVLIICTILSLLIANSPSGAAYLNIWHSSLGPLRVEQWINDGLMAIFFLLIGLELERELYVGELSSFRKALLPILAAAGGMIAPAAIHWALNSGTETQSGFGIPMATDIAFAVGVLALLGNRIPTSLKVFVVAFAVMDDLGAVLVIAIFYTAQLSVAYLMGALCVWALLIALNRIYRVMSLVPYLLGGLLMWFLMLRSGVHATVAGVLLAFAIPFTSNRKDKRSPSDKLENFLAMPVAFIVLPIFALANTGIVISADWAQQLSTANSLGILAGLLIGKPLGVTVVCLAAVRFRICHLPSDVTWVQMIGAGILGGIGFTMSIFIANLAFSGAPDIIATSKISVLSASICAGVCGFAWLSVFAKARVKA